MFGNYRRRSYVHLGFFSPVPPGPGRAERAKKAGGGASRVLVAKHRPTAVNPVVASAV